MNTQTGNGPNWIGFVNWYAQQPKKAEPALDDMIACSVCGHKQSVWTLWTLVENADLLGVRCFRWAIRLGVLR
jgi:hypothetical protein